MAPLHPCHPAPAGRAPGAPLESLGDALGTVLALLSRPPAPETLCLLLDAERRGLTCVGLPGETPPDAAAALCRVLAPLADAGVHGVVVATARPGSSAHPSPHDEAQFCALRDGLEAAGVELLDWFVVAGGLAVSLAEHLAVPSPWCSDGGR
jgi:hypothetical protein